MAINGEIRQLYADREKTKPIYPRVSSNAVLLGNGNSLEALEASVENHSSNIQSAQSDIDKLKFVILKLEADRWNGSAPYTQTVSVAGMTADWVPGIPTVVLGSSVDVSTLLAATEALGCINMITSADGTLTFTAPVNKPGASLTLRVPGQIERR